MKGEIPTVRLLLVPIALAAVLVFGGVAAADPPPEHPGECVPGNQYHPCEPPPCVDNAFHHCPTAVDSVVGFRVSNGVARWSTTTELNVVGFWLYRLGCKPSLRVDAFGGVAGHSYVEKVAGRVACPSDGRAHRWHLEVVKAR
jgi:hypothetical protein